ncbi:Cleft lip and palate transmembrane protein 1 like protein, variant 2 [Balamuthia mandrillaris]
MTQGSGGGGGGGGAPRAAAGRQQQQAAGFNWKGLLFQMFVMYAVYSFFFKKDAPQTTDPVTGKALPPHRCLFKGGEILDLYVYISEEGEEFKRFNDTSALLWREYDLSFTDSEENERQKEANITLPQSVLNNGTLYAHVFLVKKGYSPDPSSPDYRRSAVIYRAHLLNRYMPAPKLTFKKNLLSGELEDSVTDLAKAEEQGFPHLQYISFWKPNLTLNLVQDTSTFPRGSLPPQIFELLQFDKHGNYYPTLYFNEFWLMREQLFPINETTPVVPLTMSYGSVSLWKWQMMVQMQQSFQMQESLGGVEGETDEVKRMLFETNPYLLGLTLFVSVLHSIFDFLAFKNDITFWKNRKSMEGLSVRTIFLNVFIQFVIFLYLLDNDTSWIILISSGVGLLIEAWKITKAGDVSYSWPQGSYPRIHFKAKSTYTAKTKEYDDKAMQWLSYVLYPLVACYAVYSLMYQTHKSWYSWILSSLTGAIYTFGFIMMTPQLFINYKLKSVAHMPWKTFMYKALNTFVDDLFAFIIKMPTMHRLACFRDGIPLFSSAVPHFSLSVLLLLAILTKLQRNDRYYLFHILVSAVDLSSGQDSRQRVWTRRNGGGR